jgi:hypothetical protein
VQYTAWAFQTVADSTLEGVGHSPSRAVPLPDTNLKSPAPEIASLRRTA